MPEILTDDRGRPTRSESDPSESVLARIVAWEASDRARSQAERDHAENTMALVRMLVQGGSVTHGKWSYSGHQNPGLPWFVLRRPVGGEGPVVAADACTDHVVLPEDDGNATDMADYLSRIPLVIEGGDQVIHIVRSADMDGTAADQLNRAIAAIVAIEVERIRSTIGMPDRDRPAHDAPWSSRLAELLATELDAGDTTRQAVLAIANSIRAGNLESIAFADRLLKETPSRNEIL